MVKKKIALLGVEQVFLIHRRGGILLQHVAAQGSVLKDADMISGMFTAIQDFISDSLAEGGRGLETIHAGDLRLWVTYSPQIILVGVVSGVAPSELKEVFRRALDGIGVSLRDQIDNFEGDVSAFEPARPFLKDCLLGQHPEQRKKARLWPLAAAAAVILLALFARQLYTRAQWNRYFDALKRQPGIVVTNIERNGSQWVVSGLKDPLAPDPASLLRGQHLAQSEIQYAWQPFLSLNTPFAVQRELAAAVDRIRKQIIRFDNNSSKLTTSAADRIEDLSGAMGDLARIRPDARIGVIGHAYEAASPAMNEELSLARANQVVDVLAAQGIKRQMLAPTGAGNSRPLRADSDWDRSANRSVSFDVAIP